MRLLCLLTLLAIPARSHSLEPSEILLLTNRNEPESKKIAEYYCKQRGVPAENIVALDLPKVEDISRRDYETKLRTPVREILNEKKSVKVLLAIYGVPLRVGGQEPSAEEKEQLKEVEPKLKEAEEAVKKLEEKLKAPDAEKAKLNDELAPLRKERSRLTERKMRLSHQQSEAAVDSELMLIRLEKYPLTRWHLNTLHWQVPQKVRDQEPLPIMTCRLDGPSPERILKLIDDSIAVEKEGLRGNVYVDARGIKFDPKSENGYGYGGYDESMREMAELLKKGEKLKVTLDDRDELFQEGTCPDCALYCGWYSHGNFIDSCKFNRGAVAWHLASSEAVSLRQKDCKLWCKNLLEKGAVATLGPVLEPYTIGFPKPAEFFGFLATGKYPLVECYARTTNFTSWMTTLVGDPLYNPFAKNPQVREEWVTASPKGAKFLLSEGK